MLRKYFKGGIKNNELSGSTSSLFVSTTNLADTRGAPRFSRQESVIKSRNKAIVKEILENFDMEETKERYRNSKVVEFTYDANNFSFDAALSTERVKARLRRLMGTDVIRLNDQKYTETLIKRLDEEWELEMKKKEQALAEAEEERIRKLQLVGILPKEKAKNQNTVKRTKLKIRLSKQKNKRNSHEEHSDDVIEPDEKDGEDENKRVVTQLEIIENKSGNQLTRDKDSPTDLTGRQSEKNIHSGNNLSNKENLVQKEVPVSYLVREDERDQKNITHPQSGKFRRKETPFVKELRETETVERLYALAEILMIPAKEENKEIGGQKEAEVKN